MGIGKILIVDDSATSRMIIRRCLEIAGYHGVAYSEAEDGLKALAYLKDHEVDLILSDLKMPKMDGTTFIRKLKTNASTKDLPVVVISSMGNESKDLQLETEGIAAVIKKPLSPQKISAAIGPLFGPDREAGDDGLVGDLI